MIDDENKIHPTDIKTLNDRIIIKKNEVKRLESTFASNQQIIAAYKELINDLEEIIKLIQP